MPNCEFLHCTYEGFCLVLDLDGNRYLCPVHEKIVRKNGWSLVWERSGLMVFSPIMLRGLEE